MPTGDWLKNNPHLNPNPKKSAPPREELVHLYHDEKRSSRWLGKDYRVDQKKVLDWMIELNIPRRTYKDNPIPTPKGSRLSFAHRIAISEATMGRESKKGSEHYNWKGGISHPLCKKCKRPISYAGGQKNGMCLKCLSATPERRKQISDSVKGREAWNKGKSNYWAKGELNNKWKGGITPLNEQIRRLPEYFAWRTAVYVRDNRTCVNCSSRKSRSLEADHIKPFSKIVDENNIRTIEQALACSELWDIANGRTLCKRCHKEIGWQFFKDANPRKKLAQAA
jgi:protein-arginine kinase activator protein McsA